MSTQIRTSGSGRNPKKINAANVGGGGGGDAATNKKTDLPKTEKEKPQAKPTADQIRMAKLTDMDNGPEDPKMPEKVAVLIEMTQRSEEEVCCALYECDNNLDRAAVFLLETLPVGAFEISSKKKKNRVSNTTNENAGETEWTDANANNDKREKSRNRSSTRGGRGGTDSRGWRGRESRENDRNATESFQKYGGGEGSYRGSRGRGGGGVGGSGVASGRGGYGGRGGRGGRVASRGLGSRDQTRSNYATRPPQEHQEVDTWDNTIAQNAEKSQQPQDDAWGDWDNEEYVGSLKDSKVFTPSNLQNISLTTSELPTPPGMEPQTHLASDDLVQQYSTSVISNASTATAATSVGNGTTSTLNSSQFPDIHSSNAGHNLRLNNLQVSNAASQQQLSSSATLSAEQSQYFNSLSSQNTPQQQSNVNSFQNTTVQYPASYGAVFGDQSANSQPSVRRPRAKVPPPSKIPSTAVEMPVDTMNNIGYLDVQFGGLDFGTEESFDTLTEKFSATSIDTQQNTQPQDQISNEYQTKSSAVQQSTLTGGLQNTQIADSLTSSYAQRSAGSVQNQNTVGTINTAVNNSLADQLTKSDPYNQSNTPNTTGGGYQASYNSNSSTNKSGSSYQPTGSVPSYNNSSYSNSQSSSANTYQPPSNNYSSYNQNSVHSYQQQTGGVTASNSASSVSGSTVSSSTTQNIPGGNNSTVNNSSANSNAGYLTSQYQSNQTTSAYPSQQSAYQSSQSVYGGTGLVNNTGYTGSTSTSTSQYSNFSNTKLKDTSTTSNSHFDSVSSVTSSSAVSSTISSVTSSTSTTNSMSSPSLGITKVTNSSSSAAKNSAGMVQPNIQMVSQYIQTGMPYYQQPAVYSYEDLQVMQQRIPHVTQYFDINYTPTSLGAAGVRDANLGSVAYSTMTDGRYARNDNNSSPVGNVSSTMSQQTGSSGPVLNVPYAYFYGANMMPAGGFQYGTPAIYPQQMPATNATTGGQFPKPPYNSGYGATGYDALTQNTQDYTKQYPGSGVSQQAKAQNVSNAPPTGAGSDMSSSMYGGKGHVALNKVNSYENKSYHSATPPPYNLTGTQTAGATSAQPYGMYIQPMPPTHHNMGIHQPIHQMDSRVHNTSRRDSNSTGQRQQSGSQSKSGGKQGYSPSYWAGQN